MKEAGCWHKRNALCDNKYSAVNLPFSVTERHEVPNPWNTNLDNFIGFLSSMLGYEDLKKMSSDNTLLSDIKRSYLEAKGENEINPRITVMYLAFIIIGIKEE